MSKNESLPAASSGQTPGDVITRHITLSFMNSLPMDLQNAISVVRVDIGAGFGVIQLSRGCNEMVNRYRMDHHGRAVLPQASLASEAPQVDESLGVQG